MLSEYRSASRIYTGKTHEPDFNITYITIITALVMAFQAVSLVDANTRKYGIVMIIAAILSLLFLILLSVINRSKYTRQIVFLCRIHWLLLALSMTPFILADARAAQIPVNILLYCLLALSLPVFFRSGYILLFVTAFAYPVAIVILCGAGTQFVLKTFCIAAASGTIAYILHNSYIKTINRLRTECDTDGLTGLLNRRAGAELTQQALGRVGGSGKTAALLIADIDFFKDYNSLHGHRWGDEVLCKVASCLVRNFDSAYDIVFRLGGDEFVVFFAADSSDNIAAAAVRLLSDICGLCIAAAHPAVSQFLTVSIGVHLCPRHDINFTDLLSETDRQLYNAKNSGRNLVSFDDKILKR
jgi:diguanylate cyclase (GGDEF)-like protein